MGGGRWKRVLCCSPAATCRIVVVAAERQQPELTPFAALVRWWKDVKALSSSQQSVDMSRTSCTQQLIESLGKKSGACGGLLRMCCFCYPATVSWGLVSDSTS